MIPMPHALTAARLSPVVDAAPPESDGTVFDALVRRIERGDDPALRALDRRAAVIADRLAELGLGDGDRVGIAVADDDDALAAAVGVLAVGAVVVPVVDAPGAEALDALVVDRGRGSRGRPVVALELLPRGGRGSVRVWPGADLDDPTLARAVWGSRAPSDVTAGLLVGLRRLCR